MGFSLCAHKADDLTPRDDVATVILLLAAVLPR